MTVDRLPHEAYVAALAALAEVGPARLRWLLSVGPPVEVWDAVRRDRLPVSPAAGPDLRARWAATEVDPAELWDRCARLGVGVTCLGGAGYPAALASDPDPPVVLFHRGDPDVLDGPRVAVVGTRRATPYGRRVATDLGADLAAAGVGVVSGLALGIDAAAHAGAVAGEWAGPPVAVVGAGPDAPCPVRNRRLCEEVVRRGVVLGEVPPGVPAAPWRFPVRNRVLAALADAVVVVETAGAGGSMHTVREARERGVPVLAVPGPVGSPVSAGTHALLREGAALCEGAGDVLALLGTGSVDARPAPAPARPGARRPDPRPVPSSDGRVLLDALGWLPVPLATLLDRTTLPLTTALAELEVLERDGWVGRADGLVERRSRP